ncbi:hypothetical protein [Flindersiella endophytica]
MGNTDESDARRQVENRDDNVCRMTTRGVKLAMRAAAAFGLLLAFGSVAAGCGGQVHEAGEFDTKATPVKPIRSENPEPTSSSPTPTATSTPVDVCSLVPPAKVAQVFGRKGAPPKAAGGEKDQDYGIPGATPYHCTYKWGKGEPPNDVVTVTIFSDTGQPDAKTFVTSVLGEGYEEVGGAGEAAGIDRKTTFGNGIGGLAAAKKTDSGMTALLILAPQSAKVQAYSGLANAFFAKF